jgi:hypothetical protein
MVYVCTRCNYATDRKNNMKNHLYRGPNMVINCCNNINDVVLNDEKIRSILEKNFKNKDQDHQDHQQDHQDHQQDQVQDLQTQVQVQEDPNQMKCNRCKITFSSRSNFNKHLKKHKDQVQVQDKVQDKDKVQVQVQDNSQVQCDQVHEDQPRIQDTNIVVLHGYENYYSRPGHSLEKFLIKLDENNELDQCIQKVFKEMYFNKDYPENHCILYQDLTSDKVKIFKEGHKVNGREIFVEMSYDKIIRSIHNEVECKINSISRNIANYGMHVKLNNIYKNKIHNPLILTKEFDDMKEIAYNNHAMILNTKRMFEEQEPLNSKMVDKFYDSVKRSKNRSKK